MADVDEAEMPPLRRGGGGGCARCCHQLFSTVCSSMGICVLVVAYIVLGAMVFQHVEGGQEAAERRRGLDQRRAIQEDVVRSRRAAVEKLWEITITLNVLHKDNWTSLTSRELAKFQDELVAMTTRNLTAPAVSEQWNFCGSLLYSLTVITTIGYGTCSPRTDVGKLLTIAYAVLGIPLMLIYLSNIGDILARCLKFVFQGCCCCCGGRQQNKHSPLDAYRLSVTSNHASTTRLNHADGDAKNHSSYHPSHQLRNHQLSQTMPPHIQAYEPLPGQPLPADGSTASSPLPFLLCLLAMLGYILGGGYLLTLWEDWSYLDGTYFCFVSLSTIGFGEMTPGGSGGTGSGESARLSQLVSALYLLAGMALIAMCFNLMQEQVVCLLRCVARSMGLFADPADELPHQLQSAS